MLTLSGADVSRGYNSEVAVGPDGSVYVSDMGRHCVRKMDADGVVQVVAGIDGVSGFSGDGGPAVQAHLSWPPGLAFGPDGTLYIEDTFNSRVRAVRPDGTIRTVLGPVDPIGNDVAAHIAHEPDACRAQALDPLGPRRSDHLDEVRGSSRPALRESVAAPMLHLVPTQKCVTLVKCGSRGTRRRPRRTAGSTGSRSKRLRRCLPTRSRRCWRTQWTRSAILVGQSGSGRILLVVFIEQSEDSVRIISARRTTARERKRYEEGDW